MFHMLPHLQCLPAHQRETWNAWMDRVPHDFYHRAEYHLLSEREGDGIACLAVYGDERRFLAWPYLLVPLASAHGLELTDLYDITSVYGYPGPVSLNGDASASFLSEAISAIQELWHSQKAVSAFTRSNPLLQQPGLTESSGTLVPAGQTISLDLRVPLEQSWAQFRRGHRYEIRKGHEAGLVFWHDEQWRFLRDFVLLYTETMTRRHAESRYFLKESYFARLRETSGAAACHLLVALHRQDLAAAAIFTECCGIVQYHLSVMREEYRRLAPVKVLLDGTRVWAKMRGNRVLHLGGGHACAEDSLFLFKAGFSKRRHPFFVWRKVLDERKYGLLAAARAQYCARHGLLSECSSFFPFYRQPLIAAEKFSRLGARPNAYQDHKGCLPVTNVANTGVAENPAKDS
jgi:hypothetical protein